MNNFVLVGRIASDLKNETEDKKECVITVAVTRNYKNEDGIYETDIIPCYLFGDVAKNTIEWCKKNDTVGVKGHIKIKDNNIALIVDRLTFLTSKKNDEVK